MAGVAARCVCLVFVTLTATLGHHAPVPAAEPAPVKPRIVIETDAGGDPDDEQSLVRFLLYACDFDIEGILCTRPETLRPENLNPEPTGLAIVQRLLAAYREVYPRLRQHADYPPPEFLEARTVAGYDTVDDGVDLLLKAIDRDDPRPLWFSNWGTNDGTVSSLKRALDRVWEQRGPEGYARFKNRLRLCSDDLFGEHTTTRDPPWHTWVWTKFPNMDGGRWYHRFGPLTARAGGFDLERDLLTGHGPLGALYPTNTHLRQKEGDTPEFLYLIPNGLNEPEEPGWGSWAGRFGRQPDAGDRRYFWPNLRDTRDGRTHRDLTLLPWVTHLQNDFRARLDWCVTERAEANHPPVARLAGTLRPVMNSGERLQLDARPSHDPDGDRLSFEWWHYPEAGTCDVRHVQLSGSRTPQVEFTAPAVQQVETIHLILIVTDAGEPPLTRYQRVVITVEPAQN